MLKYSRNTALTGAMPYQKNQTQTLESMQVEMAPSILPKTFYVNDRSDEASNLVNLLVMESNADDAQAAAFDRQ